MALEVVGSTPIIHPIFLFIGMSSSGKTQHFDCCIRRFESCHPCQKKNGTNGAVIFLDKFMGKWSGFEVGAVVNRCPVDIESRE